MNEWARGGQSGEHLKARTSERNLTVMLLIERAL